MDCKRLRSPGEGRGTVTALIWLLASDRSEGLKVSPTCAGVPQSPLAGHRVAGSIHSLTAHPPHSREAEFLVLGIAKLLLPIVPVKRETQ